jgi:hypothetical protein
MQKTAENVEKLADCDTLIPQPEPRGRSTETTQISPSDSDLLYGVRAIALFCGMTPGQAKPLVDTGIIPTFRLPGGSTVCASKATLREAWGRYEREWRDKHPLDTKEKLRQRKQKRELKRSQSTGLSNNPVNGRPIANAGAEEKSWPSGMQNGADAG